MTLDLGWDHKSLRVEVQFSFKDKESVDIFNALTKSDMDTYTNDKYGTVTIKGPMARRIREEAIDGITGYSIVDGDISYKK